MSDGPESRQPAADQTRTEDHSRTEDQSFQEQAEARLADDSDELLDAVAQLRDMERRKRAIPPTMAEFHEMAERVEEQARHVFELARLETRHGRYVSGLQNEKPEESGREGSPRRDSDGSGPSEATGG